MLTKSLAEVFASGSPLEEVAQQWLERYTTNRPDALADIVNLILKCTGCNAKITEDDINDADNVNGRVTDLQDEYAEVSSSILLKWSYTDFMM